MRKRRIQIIDELLEFIEREGLSLRDISFPIKLRKYLKGKYGFRDETIEDYIRVVTLKLRKQEQEKYREHLQKSSRDTNSGSVSGIKQVMCIWVEDRYCWRSEPLENDVKSLLTCIACMLSNMIYGKHAKRKPIQNK